MYESVIYIFSLLTVCVCVFQRKDSFEKGTRKLLMKLTTEQQQKEGERERERKKNANNRSYPKMETKTTTKVGESRCFV